MTKDQVMNVLGEPFETSTSDDHRERWRYCAVHRQDEEVVFLGRTIRRVPYYIVENEVVITFFDGAVEAIYSQEKSLDSNRGYRKKVSVLYGGTAVSYSAKRPEHDLCSLCRRFAEGRLT